MFDLRNTQAVNLMGVATWDFDRYGYLYDSCILEHTTKLRNFRWTLFEVWNRINRPKALRISESELYGKEMCPSRNSLRKPPEELHYKK